MNFDSFVQEYFKVSCVWIVFIKVFKFYLKFQSYQSKKVQMFTDFELWTIFQEYFKVFCVWIILVKFFKFLFKEFLKISKCTQLFLISRVTLWFIFCHLRTLDEFFQSVLLYYSLRSRVWKIMKIFSSYLSRLVEYFWDIIKQVLGEVFPSWIEVGYWYLPQYQLNNVTLSNVVFIKKGLDWFGFTIQSNL